MGYSNSEYASFNNSRITTKSTKKKINFFYPLKFVKKFFYYVLFFYDRKKKNYMYAIKKEKKKRDNIKKAKLKQESKSKIYREFGDTKKLQKEQANNRVSNTKKSKKKGSPNFYHKMHEANPVKVNIPSLAQRLQIDKLINLFKRKKEKNINNDVVEFARKKNSMNNYVDRSFKQKQRSGALVQRGRVDAMK